MVKTFDYIIIGGGTAGCILASRLLQKTSATVLILEAGLPNHDPIYHVSPQFPRIGNIFRWTIVNRGALILLRSKETTGRSIEGKVGRIWGGSGTVNGSVFNLPKEVDFQSWASYSGLPVSQFANIARDIYSNTIHSSFSIEDMVYNDFIEACNKSHIAFVDDYNLKGAEGVSWIRFLHRGDQSRYSTADLLQPFLSHPRLTILSSCNADRINTVGSCAKSVECILRGKKEVFECKIAIICAAGTFATPLILQKSGIGPKGAIADLPGVGNNLRDHFGLRLSYADPNGKGLGQQENEVENLQAALSKFLFAEPHVLPGRLMLHLKSFPHLEYPDVFAEILYIGNEFLIYPVILCPFSSGTVSQDGICYHALSHPFDRIRMRRAVRAIDKIMTNFKGNAYSGITRNMTDLQLDDYILDNVISWTHPVGTCAIGLSTESVVDYKLRVHRIDRLFIADCSVLPLAVHGGTFAAALCVGEYAAKSILGELDAVPQIMQINAPSLWQIAGCQNLCSRVAIGLSHLKQTPQDFTFLDQAVANGYTTFDCAVVYSGTLPFGRWLRLQPAAIRPRLFIIGKGVHPHGGSWLSRMDRKFIFEDAQFLLDALGTTYLDCFMLHRDDSSIPVESIVRWLNELVEAGMAKSYGVSNWTLQRIRQADSYAHSAGLLPIGLVSNYCGPVRWTQPPWPGCIQMSREEARAVAEDLGIPILSWSPISPILNSPDMREELKVSQMSIKDLVASSIENIFEISPKVGVVVRTASLEHLFQTMKRADIGIGDQ